MPRRRYTKDQKAAAVLAAEASSVMAAAEQTGIPRKTIEYWLDKPQFADLRQKSQEERAEQFRVVAQMALGRLVELLPSMKAHDLVVLMGVATEKAQLLEGKATARTENVSITDGLDDHEKRLLGDAVRNELARRADSAAAVPAVGSAGPEGADTASG